MAILGFSDPKVFIPEIIGELTEAVCDTQEYVKALPSFKRVLGRAAEPIARAYFIDHSPKGLPENLARQIYKVNQMWFFVFPHPFCQGFEREGWRGVRIPSLEGVVVLKDKQPLGCSVLREYNLLSQLPKNEGIMEVLGMVRSPNGDFLILPQFSMDSYDATHSHALFCTTAIGSIAENNIKLVALQLISGLAFLHEHQVIHGDIKPENALVLLKPNSSQEIVKAVWSDFSFSCKWSDIETRKRASGSPYYVSPELAQVVRSGEKGGVSLEEKVVKVNTYAKDLWALGVTFSVLFGKILSPGFREKVMHICFARDNMEKIAQLANGIIEPSEWVENMSVPPNSVESLIQGFLKIDSTKRTPLREALANVQTLQVVPMFLT